MELLTLKDNSDTVEDYATSLHLLSSVTVGRALSYLASHFDMVVH